MSCILCVVNQYACAKGAVDDNKSVFVAQITRRAPFFHFGHIESMREDHAIALLLCNSFVMQLS